MIYWGSDGHKQPRLIIPTDKRKTTYLLSILNYVGTTVGRKDFEEIMGTEIEFSYPKPLILLKKILATVTGKEKSHTTLDFFSGFRVIIMTVANSLRKSRVLELLPKFKIKKMNRWCAV